MTDAVIIPFPGRRPQPPVEGAPAVDSDQERLRTALEGLRAALTEQRRALADWRFAMTELGIGVAGLGQSLHGYHAALQVADEKVAALRAQALTLKDWAEGQEN